MGSAVCILLFLLGRAFVFKNSFDAFDDEKRNTTSFALFAMMMMIHSVSSHSQKNVMWSFCAMFRVTRSKSETFSTTASRSAYDGRANDVYFFETETITLNPGDAFESVLRPVYGKIPEIGKPIAWSKTRSSSLPSFLVPSYTIVVFPSYHSLLIIRLSD